MISKQQNKNSNHKEVQRKYKAPSNPYQKTFLEIDNLQREFAYKEQRSSEK